MADKLEILKMKATNQAGGLIPAVLNANHIPKSHQLSQIIKCLDNPSDKVLPNKKAHEFFNEVKQDCLVSFERPSKMLTAAEKTISAITAKETQGKVIAYANPADKKFIIGSHKIQQSVEEKLNTAIAAIGLDAAKRIQTAISDHVTTDLIPAIRALDVREEILNNSRSKWIALHGGTGKANFLDAVHLVVRPISLDDTADSDGGSAARQIAVTEKILLSDAVFSYALFCARQEAAQTTAEKERAAAVQEEADKKATALKTAASAAAAARPSPATDQSIKQAVEDEVAKLRREVAELRRAI